MAFCIRKVLRIVGISDNQIRVIKTDDEFRLNTVELLCTLLNFQLLISGHSDSGQIRHGSPGDELSTGGTTAHNPFSGSWEAGSGVCTVESRLIEWIAKLFGLPSSAGGRHPLHVAQFPTSDLGPQ
jgi:hypothetical protein